MSGLQIYDPRDRALVAAADALLRPMALTRRWRRPPASAPSRVIVFRLERVGDLLMTLPALAALRAALPDASIDLVVGSWNRELAAQIEGIERVETLDGAWLARPAAGLGTAALARHARAWRRRKYDLAINFEPDIRTNIALAALAPAWSSGFSSGGGGALLDVALDFDTGAHTSDNMLRLVRVTLGLAEEPPPPARLTIPEAHRLEAERLLLPFAGTCKAGIHVSGGRAIKQWPEERFREVAVRLVEDRQASIVLTGTPAERSQIAAVAAALPPARVLDLSSGVDLLTVAAVLRQLDVYVTGDTGPMHLANAVGTPIVAIFGPSDPARYAPRGLRDQIVCVDLPCSPCNRIRKPPARCTGHTPDCLTGVDSARVLAAIDEVLGVRG